MSRVPVLATLPPEVVTLGDHTKHARTVLDANAWAYFSGGAGDEITLRANRAAWDGLALQPRVLRPLAGGHTRLRLLGRSMEHPILLAPVAFQRMAHPDGELASALAAATLGAGMVVSTQASVSLEAVADTFLSESARGPLWFQLYMQHDRGFTRALVERAERAGYEALVLTVDAPTHGARDRERRENFRLPMDVHAVNLAGLPPAPPPRLNTQDSALFQGLLHHAPTWDDLTWLHGITQLPIVLKGIMHPDDARQAVQHGVAAVVVSNHGGRTLDTSPASAAVLPRIAEALQGVLPLLVDGGIQRGTDVLKALALGASAVQVGRPYIYALANAGALGVAHVLKLLRDELEIAMALCGCATLADIDRDVLWSADPH